MYGLINAALRELIVTHHGVDAWDRIAALAAPDVPRFDKMAPYPDELTYRIVEVAHRVTGVEVDTLIDQLGELWVKYTDAQGYGSLFDIAGDSLPDFLLSLDTVHARVGRSFPGLKPPSFRFDRVGERVLRMHYLSTRSGLCPMIFGLMRGLSLRFATEVEVVEEACARRGAAHCEFLVTFPRRGIENEHATSGGAGQPTQPRG
jgi:hypothetical protein